jgi:D-glycero-D-manno-heptose 1,7-bisphosphate phosphatase
VSAAAAVFLDRDGVLNVRPPEHEYVTDASGFRWLTGAAEGVAALNRAGYRVIVVSNQRGVARGVVSSETLAAVEARVADDLRAAGGTIEAFYYCTHDLADDCDCRKPRPGLLLRAAAELDVDLGRSAMIGDSETDVEAGRAAGCATTILIAPEGTPTEADAVAADLQQAAAILSAATVAPGSPGRA